MLIFPKIKICEFGIYFKIARKALNVNHQVTTKRKKTGTLVGGYFYFVSLPHSGGGVDCTKLSDDKFSLADLEDHTGDWQRVGAYSSWLSARIFEETQPGRNTEYVQRGFRMS